MTNPDSSTRPAGEGVDDDEMVKQVADQTANDLAVQEAFEREEDGAHSDKEIAEDPA
jgi:hypothetical protein